MNAESTANQCPCQNCPGASCTCGCRETAPPPTSCTCGCQAGAPCSCKPT